MEKGYKVCPYCANEIKEDAIKCQFCNEKLSKNNNEENSNLPNKRAGFIIGIIIGVTLILVILGVRYFFFQGGEKSSSNVANNEPTTIEKKYDNQNSETINSDNSHKVYDDLEKIIKGYYGNMDTVGDLIVQDNNDYKDLDIVNKYIENWKLYKEYSNKYLNEIENLMHKTPNYKEDEYLSNFFPTTIKFLNEENRWAELNIKHLEFLSSVQDEFFISDEGKITFYDNEDDYEKHYQMVDNLVQEAENYNKLYDEYLALFGG